MTWKSIPQDLLEIVNEILNELKEHDEATYEHCLRVSHLCTFLAEAAGLSETEKLKAQFAGLLHDVGKAKIPLSILNKPGKLTEEEYQFMQKHSILSAEMLEPLEHSPFFRQVQLAVLHHHERIDGKGYPLKLEDEQIPYISRLILIVDTVDAMTQTRAYRKGLPMDVVYKELKKFAGLQFDAELVNIFISAHQALESSDPMAEVIPLPQRIKVA